jgi:hypothetical protein
MKLSTIVESRQPRVGIWWEVDGQLVSFSVPYREAQVVSGFRDSPYDHDQMWTKIIATYPHLADKEYYEIPRGRVIMDANQKTYRALSSKDVCGNQALRKKIERDFSLPPSLVTWVSDTHYELNPDIDWD